MDSHVSRIAIIPATVIAATASVALAAHKDAALPTSVAGTTTVAAPIAFPGAFGYGAKATGGRGGEIYHVTNLGDSGPGSFREAVGKGHRIVVFDVGGYIDLKAPLGLSSDLTIAGQTAPGEGVCVRNYEVTLANAKNVIVRYMRFRQGLTKGQDKKYTIGLNDTATVIFDHCSIEWGRWDCIGMSRSTDITVQNCMIGEGIDPQRFGCLCQSDNVTFSHNLWLNNQSRNPKAKGKVQYYNNVVYNWGVTGYVGGHSAADHPADVINNYFIKGPSSNDHFAGEFTATDHVYFSGNVVDLDRDGTLNGKPVNGSEIGTVTLVPKPNFPLPTNLDTAEEALHKVIAGAGDSLHRDAIDSRLIDEVKSFGKRGTITHDPATLGGFGTIQGGKAPSDTDGDSIPDAWETAHGLNLKDASDGAKDAGNGWTNVEVYLNSLVG